MAFSKKIIEMIRKFFSSRSKGNDDLKKSVMDKEEIKLVDAPISLNDVKDDEELEMLTQCINLFEVSSNNDTVDFSITVPKDYEAIWRNKLANLTLMQDKSENVN